MLTRLSIRDVALIRALDLEPGEGLISLTGQTGAGKSIILEALGLCLGGPADKGAVRAGAAAASVSAVFELAPDHPAWALLEARGVLADPAAPLICRRVVPADKPARAFINDQAVGAACLAELGETLVEIHGQGAASALLRPSAHVDLLDHYAGAQRQAKACREAWRRYSAAREARVDGEAEAARARAARDELADAYAALEALDAQPGEATRLEARRARLRQAGKLMDDLETARSALAAEPVEAGLVTAARALDRVRRLPGFGRDEPDGAPVHDAAEGAERALIELRESLAAVTALAAELDAGAADLEAVDERLHALKGAGRRHGADPDALDETAARIAAQLAAAEDRCGALDAAREAEADAAAQWRTAADALGKARRTAARRFERAVETELSALRLEQVRVRAAFRPIGADEPGARGAERVEFEVETNRGAGFGPLRQIASGGELARMSLAMTCVLVEAGAAGTLIFDEVDQGVGGAVAAAVGERLRRLAGVRQVFAVTHSPQVAAAAETHWRVAKAGSGRRRGETRVCGLDAGERTEEIARMLSGATVTEEARAAAQRLLEEA